MVTRHADAVARYLEANAATLPAIAVRETRTKLATGTKSGKSCAKRRLGRRDLSSGSRSFPA